GVAAATGAVRRDEILQVAVTRGQRRRAGSAVVPAVAAAHIAAEAEDRDSGVRIAELTEHRAASLDERVAERVPLVVADGCRLVEHDADAQRRRLALGRDGRVLV